MQARWQQFEQHFVRLSMRERILVTATLLIALAVSWYLIFGGPMLVSSNQNQLQQQKLHADLEKLKLQQLALMQKLQQDPLHDLKQRLLRLNRQLADTDMQLRGRLQGLIAPQQMTRVLESVLQQHHELKLLKVQSLPAQPLVARPKSEEKSGTHKTTEVYRHGLQLEFEGSYLATLAYLKALQALPWDFYWDAVRLEVEKYPRARVTIQVHTLSLTKGWIGV